MLVKPVRRVERVDVRTLQPVPSHDTKVDEEVVLLELFEVDGTTATQERQIRETRQNFDNQPDLDRNLPPLFNLNSPSRGLLRSPILVH